MGHQENAKYLIKATIKVDGTVQRKDVVGAIFGQTEGLLGDEFDLRSLQRGGRLGHVEVNIESQKGKVNGVINIPSSLGNVETSIIGAALETIDRIGPCNSVIKIDEIMDVRVSKRQNVVDRARNLLLGLVKSSSETSRTVVEEVRSVLTVEEASTWEGMTIGPNVNTSDAIIIVEGRNDVLNLLNGGIKNAIAVEGAGVRPELIELATKKNKVTVFVDGDRGGELVLRELAGAINVSDVALAPFGQEVEHLEMKTITKCLAHKEPVERVLQRFDEQLEEEEEKREKRHNKGKKGKGKKSSRREKKQEAVIETKEVDEAHIGLISHMKGLDKQHAVVLTIEDEVSEPISASKLAETLSETEGAEVLVFNGAVNDRIVEMAGEANLSVIVGVKVNKDLNVGEGIIVYSTDDFNA